MGELIPEHRELIAATSMQMTELSPVVDVLPAFLQGVKFKKKPLKPWYGRGW